MRLLVILLIIAFAVPIAAFLVLPQGGNMLSVMSSLFLWVFGQNFDALVTLGWEESVGLAQAAIVLSVSQICLLTALVIGSAYKVIWRMRSRRDVKPLVPSAEADR